MRCAAPDAASRAAMAGESGQAFLPKLATNKEVFLRDLGVPSASSNVIRRAIRIARQAGSSASRMGPNNQQNLLEGALRIRPQTAFQQLFCGNSARAVSKSKALRARPRQVRLDPQAARRTAPLHKLSAAAAFRHRSSR